MTIRRAQKKRGDAGMSKLVKVTAFPNPAAAHIFKNLLAAQGIEAFIFDEQLQVLIALPTMGVKVMVREQDRARARELLRELETSEQMQIRYLDDN